MKEVLTVEEVKVAAVQQGKRKLVSLNLDGIISAKGDIDVSMANRLIRLQQEGNTLAIVSNKPIGVLKNVAEKLQLKDYAGYIIYQNGSMIYDCLNDEVIYDEAIPEEVLTELLDICETWQDNLTMFYQGEDESTYVLTDNISMFAINVFFSYWMYVSQVREVGDGTIPEEAIRSLTICYSEENTHTSSKHWVDVVKEKMGNKCEISYLANWVYSVTKAGVNNGEALRWLAELIDMPKENVIYFGYDMCDIPALKVAEVGVTTTMTRSDVKEAGNILYGMSFYDCVASYIDNYILGY